MINAQFKNLCREASLVLGVSDVEAFSLSGEICVEGVDIAAHFEEDLAPDRIFCYLDVGQIDNDSAAIRKLLTLNLASGSKADGVFALDATSGDALLVVHLLNPDGFDGQSMADSLCRHAARASAARELLV